MKLRFLIRRIRWVLRCEAWDDPVWLNEWDRRRKQVYDTTYGLKPKWISDWEKDLLRQKIKDATYGLKK